MYALVIVGCSQIPTVPFVFPPDTALRCCRLQVLQGALQVRSGDSVLSGALQWTSGSERLQGMSGCVRSWASIRGAESIVMQTTVCHSYFEGKLLDSDRGEAIDRVARALE